MQTQTDVELVVDARAKLGEGPVWDDREQVLWWLDIVSSVLHRYDPDTEDTSLQLQEPVTAVVPRSAGGLMGTVADGFATIDTETGRLNRVAACSTGSQPMRMNDGKCDPQGRFWAGTMTFDFTPGASLYRLDPGGNVTTVLEDVKLSNGLGWSPDDKTMYYIDTMTHGIDAFDFAPESGEISNRRRLVTIDEAEGLPDGMTVDTEGFLWVALFDGFAVRRYTPDGEIDGDVRLPVGQVTCPAFGGADLGDLYVTTAAEGIRQDDTPGAGGLYRFRPGVKGLPTNRFADEHGDG